MSILKMNNYYLNSDNHLELLLLYGVYRAFTTPGNECLTIIYIPQQCGSSVASLRRLHTIYSAESHNNMEKWLNFENRIPTGIGKLKIYYNNR